MRILLAALALAPTVAAQPTDLFDTVKPVIGHDFAPSTVIGAMEVGNFTVDLLPDAVVMTKATAGASTGTLELCYGPGVYNGVFPIPLGDVTCFAVLPEGAPTGLDALAVSTAAGIELWYIENLTWVSAPILTGVAQNARCLRSCNLNGSGPLDLVGIGSAGGAVFTILDATTTANLGFFGVSPAAYDVQPLNWQGNDECELALLLNGDVRVTDQSGVQLASLGAGNSSWSIAIVQQEGMAYDRIAGTAQAGANEHLWVWDNSGPLEPMAWLNPQDCVSAVSADLNFDGLGDLVVPRQSSQNVRVYINEAPTTPTFKEHFGANNQLIVLGDEEPSPLNASVPAIADFDMDGDPDILLADQLDNRVTLVRNKHFENADIAPDVLDNGYYEYNEAADEGTVALILDTSAFTQVATQYHMVGWKSVDGSAALSTASVGTVHGPLESDGTTAVRFPLSTSIFADDVYWFDIRCIHPGTGYQSTPRIIAFFTKGNSEAQLDGHPGIGLTDDLYIQASETGLVLEPFDVGGGVQTGVREADDMPCYDTPDHPGGSGGDVPDPMDPPTDP